MRGLILAILRPTFGISEDSRVDIDLIHLQYYSIPPGEH